jgi:hypothetical protein
MKRTVSALLCALLLLVAHGASAQNSPTVVADQPAATLLLPYFDVDLSSSTGRTTYFSVNNASATSILAHVVVWSDLGVPVMNFDLYLTGFDSQLINMRALLNGTIPSSASVGQDGSDTISPQGPLSQDINFASCNGMLPKPNLSAGASAAVRAALTGKAVAAQGGTCAGTASGNLARGYITIDTVNACSTMVPGDSGYLDGTITDQNVLWGDYYYTDAATFTGVAQPLVHIRANSTDSRLTTSGNYTFYGRYVGWSGADHRQPLATSFAVRYEVGGAPFASPSQLTVWRDSKVAQWYFDCPATKGSRPTWYPLDQESIVTFNNQEDPHVPQPPVVFPPQPVPQLVPFPAATQKVTIDGAALPVAFNAGWLYLNLNQDNITAGDNPPADPAAAQAWVTVLHNRDGVYRSGTHAAVLDSAVSGGYTRHFAPGN